MRLMIDNPECVPGRYRRSRWSEGWYAEKHDGVWVEFRIDSSWNLSAATAAADDWERIPDPPPVTMGFVEAVREAGGRAVWIRRACQSQRYEVSDTGQIWREHTGWAAYFTQPDILATDWIVEERT